LVDLAIINPSLDDDTGQLWDVSEKPWTDVNAFDTLRTLMVISLDNTPESGLCVCSTPIYKCGDENKLQAQETH